MTSVADKVRVYRRHGNVTAAAAEAGISYTTMWRHLRAAGVKTAGHRKLQSAPRRTVAELCDLYTRGLTQRDIAALSGVTQRAAREMLKREGVPVRARSGPPGPEQRERRRAVLAEVDRLDLLEVSQ